MSPLDKFLWDEETGRGYYPVHEFVYDDKYFDKYVGYADTPIGKKLLKFRLQVAEPYAKDGGVLDIGIGSGAFVGQFNGRSAGYDVNPSAIEYLKKRNKWCDFYNDSLDKFSVITFFDSLEHIDKLEDALKRITHQHIVISIPIFRNREHVLKSKHFRMDEHFHYFTRDGFVQFMNDQGFSLCEQSDGEIKSGREDIYTFVFKRIKYEEKIPG